MSETIKQIKISRIIEIVANYYDVDAKNVYMHRRFKTLVTARHTAIWLARHFTGRSYHEIASVFGMDHSTAMHAIESIGNRMKTDTRLLNQVAELEEIIGREIGIFYLQRVPDAV